MGKTTMFAIHEPEYQYLESTFRLPHGPQRVYWNQNWAGFFVRGMVETVRAGCLHHSYRVVPFHHPGHLH